MNHARAGHSKETRPFLFSAAPYCSRPQSTAILGFTTVTVASARRRYFGADTSHDRRMLELLIVIGRAGVGAPRPSGIGFREPRAAAAGDRNETSDQAPARRVEVHNRARTDRAERSGAEPERRKAPGGPRRASVGRVYTDHRSAMVAAFAVTLNRVRNSSSSNSGAVCLS